MGFRYRGQLVHVRQPYYDSSYDEHNQNKMPMKSTRHFIHRATVKSSTRHSRLPLKDRIFLQSIGLTLSKRV